MDSKDELMQERLPMSKRQTMSRREMIKQSGLAALGLVYFTPRVEIIRTVSKSTLNTNELSGFGSSSGSKSGSES